MSKVRLVPWKICVCVKLIIFKAFFVYPGSVCIKPQLSCNWTESHDANRCKLVRFGRQVECSRTFSKSRTGSPWLTAHFTDLFTGWNQATKKTIYTKHNLQFTVNISQTSNMFFSLNKLLMKSQKHHSHVYTRVSSTN